jgi:hypothetical protein
MGSCKNLGAAARTWGRRRGRGGQRPKGTRGRGLQTKGGRGGQLGLGEIVGSHPMDQDLWPKHALTPAPDPSVKFKKSYIASLRLCLLKLLAPIAQNTEEKKK